MKDATAQEKPPILYSRRAARSPKRKPFSLSPSFIIQNTKAEGLVYNQQLYNMLHTDPLHLY
jgi:hypothetical protein